MKKFLRSLIRQTLKGNRLKYAAAILSMAVAVMINFLTPLVFSETIDAVIGGVRPLQIPGALGDWIERLGGRAFLLDRLWLVALALIVLNLVGGAFQYLRGRFTAEASEDMAKKMRDQLYAHIQRLPYDYHVSAATGDLIQRATSDVDTVRRFLGTQFVEMFRTVLMISVAISVMVRLNARMTLASVALVPLIFTMAMVFYLRVRKSFAQMDAAEGKMSAVLQENLTGVRVVRAFGRQQFEVEKFGAANDALYMKSKHLSDLMAVFWSSSDFMIMLQTAITLVYGVYVAVSGQLTVGEMTVFISYVGMLLWPVRQLARLLSDLGKAIVSMERIGEVLSTAAEPEEPDALRPPLNRDIAFEHVGFAYKGGQMVLKDVDFTLRAGQTAAILGATGSGKSTWMHLMQRLYEPTTGRITIGGVDLRDIDKAHLRARVGLVLQEPFLYSRTIGENIAFARPDAQDQDIISAAREASASLFIDGFEKGYATLVGERGVTLSGGQKQRIAMARALIRDSDILIFDDSLSAVDTETDAEIRAALKARAGQKTTFIISHRLTTLSEADVIFVLEGGVIAQRGTHRALIQQDGLYRRVYRIQGALEDELLGEGGAANAGV